MNKKNAPIYGVDDWRYYKETNIRSLEESLYSAVEENRNSLPVLVAFRELLDFVRFKAIQEALGKEEFFRDIRGYCNSLSDTIKRLDKLIEFIKKET